MQFLQKFLNFKKNTKTHNEFFIFKKFLWQQPQNTLAELANFSHD